MTLLHDVIERVSAVVDPVYLVGGSVRDALMGRECADFDFATPLGPDLIEQAVRAAGRRPYLTGKRYGTVAFRLDGLIIEVTTFRSETYQEGSRQPSVRFLPDLEQDLGRRDFTINAMALHGDELIDLFGGRDDLEAGIVRAVGDPAARFTEDPLRMLRAARFVSELDFRIDGPTSRAAVELAAGILSVAHERWMLELDRLLVGTGVERALRLLADTGLLPFLLPEISLQRSMAPVGDDSWRPANGDGGRETLSERGPSLFDRTIEAVGLAPAAVTARWAALLENAAAPYVPDPGPAEPQTPSRDDAIRRDARRDSERAALGGEIVERTGLYLKWSNRRREDVKRLVVGGAAGAHDGPMSDDDAPSG
jgi:poly(A) polymerase